MQHDDLKVLEQIVDTATNAVVDDYRAFATEQTTLIETAAGTGRAARHSRQWSDNPRGAKIFLAREVELTGKAVARAERRFQRNPDSMMAIVSLQVARRIHADARDRQEAQTASFPGAGIARAPAPDPLAKVPPHLRPVLERLIADATNVPENGLPKGAWRSFPLLVPGAAPGQSVDLAELADVLHALCDVSLSDQTAAKALLERRLGRPTSLSPLMAYRIVHAEGAECDAIRRIGQAARDAAFKQTVFDTLALGGLPDDMKPVVEELLAGTLTIGVAAQSTEEAGRGDIDAAFARNAPADRASAAGRPQDTPPTTVSAAFRNHGTSKSTVKERLAMSRAQASGRAR